jgi:hypothetical protein
MSGTNLTSIDQRSSMVSITIPYLPDEDISVWVKSTERRKRMTETFHARTIALHLAEYISSELSALLSQQRGLEVSTTIFMPTMSYLLNDPKGDHDAFVLVSKPEFLQDNWHLLYELVQREAKYIAKGHHGRVFILHDCNKGPAR